MRAQYNYTTALAFDWKLLLLGSIFFSKGLKAADSYHPFLSEPTFESISINKKDSLPL